MLGHSFLTGPLLFASTDVTVAVTAAVTITVTGRQVSQGFPVRKRNELHCNAVLGPGNSTASLNGINKGKGPTAKSTGPPGPSNTETC